MQGHACISEQNVQHVEMSKGCPTVLVGFARPSVSSCKQHISRLSCEGFPLRPAHRELLFCRAMRTQPSFRKLACTAGPHRPHRILQAGDTTLCFPDSWVRAKTAWHNCVQRVVLVLEGIMCFPEACL